MKYRLYLCYSLYLLLILFDMSSLQAQPQHAKNIYIAENDGLVYSHDGGKTFNEYDPKTTGIIDAPVYSIFVVGNTIYAGTDKGLSISYNNGQHFVTRTTRDGLGDNVISSIYVRGKNIYVGTENGLSISHDNGKSFINHLSSNSIFDIHIDEHGKIYVIIASHGPLVISDDGGKSFHRVKPTVSKSQSISDIDSSYNVAVVGQNIYVTTDAGLYVSHDGGKTLVGANIGDDSETAVYARGKQVYVVFPNYMLISHNNGKTFTHRKIPNYNVGAIMALGQDIYGVGGCGYVVSHDDGKTFEHKMNNYQFKITSITPCIERYNATNDVFLTG